jgi:heat shock protein HslJ
MKNIIYIAIAIALVLGGCKSQKNMAGANELNGEWNVVELPGISLGEKKPTITFNIQENKVAAYAGCNRMAGTVQSGAASAGGLKISNLISTKMFCMNDMATEAALAKALEAVATFEITKETCTFFDAGKKKLMVARK